MTPSKLKPFFAYLSEEQFLALKQFSKKTGSSMSMLIREGIDARLSSGDQFVAGYNQAMQDAIAVINNNSLSKMSFPSGKTFGEMIIDDLKLYLRHQHEPRNQKEEDQGIPSDPGAAA